MFDTKNEPVRPRGVDRARVMSVIETTALRGLGTEGDPVRHVIQYWSMDGEILAERDKFASCSSSAGLRKKYGMKRSDTQCEKN